MPQLLTLENGVTVLAFGRPGVHLLFSRDGKGEVWEHPVHLGLASPYRLPLVAERGRTGLGW